MKKIFLFLSVVQLAAVFSLSGDINLGQKVTTPESLLALDSDKNNVLHIIAKRGKAQMAGDIVSLFANSNDDILDLALSAQNKEGNTPLHEAARYENKHILELFISSITKKKLIKILSLLNKERDSVLHTAIKGSSYFGGDLVSLILASINTQSVPSRDCVSFLRLGDGADFGAIELALEQGKNDTLFALLNGIVSLKKLKKDEKINLLYTKNYANDHAFHLAVRNNYKDAVSMLTDMLLGLGSSPKEVQSFIFSKNKLESNVFHIALGVKNNEILRSLVNTICRLDPTNSAVFPLLNELDLSGKSPLYYAFLHCNKEGIEILTKVLCNECNKTVSFTGSKRQNPFAAGDQPPLKRAKP